MRMRSAKFANKITSNIPLITQIERGTRGNIVLHNSKEERLSPTSGRSGGGSPIALKLTVNCNKITFT